MYSAQKAYEFFLNFLSEDQLVFFPADELLRAETLASGREIMAQRLYAMAKLREPGKKILITHPAALLRYLPNPERFDEETLNIKVGDSIDLGKFKERLVSMGYQSVNKIDRSLEFANRGDILDVFPVSSDNPIRFEFFGDQIESIRIFNLREQTSIESLGSAKIIPASDIFLSDEELCEFAKRANERLEGDKANLPTDQADLLSQNVGQDIEYFVMHDYRGYLYKYYGFALNKAFSITSYFDPELIFVADRDQLDKSYGMLYKEARDYLYELRNKCQIISGLEEYMPLTSALRSDVTLNARSFASSPDDIQFKARGIITTGRSLTSIITTISTYLSGKGKVVLCLPDDHQRETVISLLKENNIEYENVKGLSVPSKKAAITKTFLNEGFEIPSFNVAYISANDLFGKRSVLSRFSSRFKEATILKSYEELHPGDYVVHEFHGIGQFLGIKEVEQKGVHRDYLYIAYANNEFLYVPLEQFRLVRKYAGKEGSVPKISHLSSGEWEKKKARIKERVNELADRLIALYGDRTKLAGYAFPLDDEFQAQFENEFPFPLTPDQATSLAEIKADMEKPEIMDRLLCGDVGFGKTEVAFRCAFKAINSGKQVAILCPTTLLARQHYELARERFSSFGIKIASFSRLVPPKEQKENIELIKEGKIHLVIGTHRLLSKDFQFKDLGLLIIDEEQRFGVEQKERIKEFKKNVDVLTLSATPIPRTLQMSLVGIRPLSQINTAPEMRMPIQTYVIPYEDDVVAELVSRELNRNGQVFYVHNSIESIYNRASTIASMCPHAKIGVIHGRMDKDEVEDVMEKFYDGELNVLVATSIIENGIDVPNANMLLVEDADKFGLSQLYQIKGRVGRGSRIAYAYLMYRPRKSLNEDAQKRLAAIQEFTELGSGYKIAQRDLMIRGAGDILGPEQAGFIDSIGLDLYLKMLNEAVDAKQKGEVVKPPVPKKMFKIDAYIPSDYASSPDKIALYQDLDAVRNLEGLKEYSKKMKDIYGKIPDTTKALIQKKNIDLLAEGEEFSGIEEIPGGVDIRLSDNFSKINGIGAALFSSLIPYLKIVKVTFIQKKLDIRVTKRDFWLKDLEEILIIIHKLYLRATQTQ
ncbi:MAG: transcription-repair coupling factor [Bacilli bacterium]|nr:transcription-repair coupling factor [Bacilli bacterium]